MFFRFVQNNFENKAIIAPDFRLELAGADHIGVEMWAPFNTFGFIFESTSTKSSIHVGDLVDDAGALPSETFLTIPACTEARVTDNGRMLLLSLLLRPLHCCCVSYDFPDRPVFRLKNDGVASICRGLADDINRRDFRNLAPIESKISALLAAITDITSARDPVQSGLPPETLARVVLEIETRLADRLTNDALAAIAGLSVDTFRRRFQVSTGVPPHQYIARARAARARQLIEDGRMSLAEIALEAGYSSQPHMSRMFLETFGVSPGRFKRMRA